MSQVISNGVCGVLFDCDGVLVDSEPITNAVLRTMLHELGWAISAQECIELFIGRALRDQRELIFEHSSVWITEDWLAEFRTRRDAQLRAQLQAIEGAAAAVRAAADRFDSRIACATGADLGKATMQLEMTGLLPLFAGQLYSGMDQPRSKPAPDVYLAAAAGIGIDPATALVIEDTVSGVRAGVAAGATVLGFCPGGPAHTSPETLRAAGAQHTFSHMDQLAELLGCLTPQQ
ncbi:HAD family phosphatase [Glutamicibacter sp. PS]|uniref:HAD family hydrolase n=1 Tax=Glutamicibacter sp. PS TaxID=3075634 RepID=UPI002847BC2F|nr:HAD family phosphatase [Glutamicibacter sp. PS]MDR4534325.1 HAD family phosphatase [Glutamicibacter sp. PS]